MNKLKINNQEKIGKYNPYFEAIEISGYLDFDYKEETYTAGITVYLHIGEGISHQVNFSEEFYNNVGHEEARKTFDSLSEELNDSEFKEVLLLKLFDNYYHKFGEYHGNDLRYTNI